MSALTNEQIEHIRRHRERSAKALARELKADVGRVEAELAGLPAPRPRVAPLERLLGFLAPIGLVVLGLLAYANNVDCGFHFDDSHAIVMNKPIREPTLAGIASYNLYRQVLYWTFAASFALHKLDVRGWHLENNAIHAVNGALVYLLALVTFRAMAPRGPKWPRLTATLAAAVFVVHPLATQAVTYLTQRTESLCATFSFLGLILYAHVRVARREGRFGGARPWLVGTPFAAAVLLALGCVFLSLRRNPDERLVWLGAGGFLGVAALGGGLAFLHHRRDIDVREAALLGAAAVSTLLAMGVKEVAGMVPLIAIAWEALFAGGAGAPRLDDRPPVLRAFGRQAYALPWAALLLGLAPLAVQVGLGQTLLSEKDEAFEPGGAVTSVEYARTQLNVLATYLRLFLVPAGQSIDWSYPRAASLFDGPTFLSLVVFLGLVAAAAVAAKRRRSDVTFGVVLALAVLAPTSSFFLLPDLVFEHRTYMAIAGAALVAVATLETVLRRVLDERPARHAFLILGTTWVVCLTMATVARNRVWLDEDTLWKDAIAKTGGTKPRPYVNLATFYQGVEPDEVLLFDGNKLQGELVEVKGGWALKKTLGPPAQPILLTPGQLVARRPLGGTRRAIELYEKVLSFAPTYYKGKSNLALCEKDLAEREIREGELGFQRLRATNDPREAAALEKALRQIFASGREHLLKAERLMRELLVQRPKDHVVRNNLGNLYFVFFVDRLDDAQRELEKALEIKDDAPTLRAVMGEVRFHQALVATDAAKRREHLAAAESEYLHYLAREAHGPSPDHIRQRLKLTSDALKTGELPKDLVEKVKASKDLLRATVWGGQP